MNTTPAAPFSWQAIMTFGLGRLGWSPDVFWTATPREIAAALQAHSGGPGALGPDELQALMQRFPDS